MAKKSTPVEKPAPRSNRDKAVGDDEAKASKARTASKRVAARKSTARADAAGSVNGKNLIIVESPAKARTIERYLGSDFRVMASVGHVIDLPPTRLGVDPEHDFQPEYVIIKGKKTVLDNLKKSARAARAVYLAPDPDREGEAIAHHIAEYIRDANSEIHRATFNEITKTAVRSAIEHPRPINVNLFNAQQARRVLDRLVGYKLSPLLWKKVRRGLSAGRVQSVAVRICCDREREIRAFKSEEYWTIEGLVSAKLPPPFKIRLDKIDGEKAEVPNEEAANRIVAEVRGKELEVGDVIKKEVAKRPFPPFITSTLQQEASRKLRMTAARTMSLAQRLYEGVELGDQGSVALITYMRTDSTRLSDDALTQIRGHIRETYGPDYLPERPRAYAARKEAQEAHEAIRPTDISMTPERVAPYLEKPLLALYTLIWKRAVASQIVDARLERTRIEIPVGRYLFIATGSVIKFDGFLIAY
ncbi:MAG TPA: type I DNA topoisomerase, partial [Candidatus Sumerlaeota bacterium]|nr:type I DNA topoisomerase [Candidatus Sumerlaeota bacterium]